MLNNEESNKSEPSDVSTMKTMLRQAGITDYDPAVIHQLLYFMNNHITNILENAMTFSEHANKTETDNSDIMLALKIQRENEVPPISRNINAEIASEKNSIPLPEIKQQDGIRLPPERYCLSSANYKLKATPVVIPKQQFIQNAPCMISVPVPTSACNDNYSRTILKRSKLTNIPDQRIVFRPSLKINIKQGENEYQIVKKPRLN